MINEFKGKYFFLSNYYACKVTFNSITYGNTEAAFQAQKCPTRAIEFATLTPNRAKALGRHVRLRKDWEKVKDSIMEAVVTAKFEQNPELMTKLIATGDEKLVEGTTWNDTYWGVDLATGKGKNKLGKILMKIRNNHKK